MCKEMFFRSTGVFAAESSQNLSRDLNSMFAC